MAEGATIASKWFTITCVDSALCCILSSFEVSTVSRKHEKLATIAKTNPTTTRRAKKTRHSPVSVLRWWERSGSSAPLEGVVFLRSSEPELFPNYSRESKGQPGRRDGGTLHLREYWGNEAVRRMRDVGVRITDAWQALGWCILTSYASPHGGTACQTSAKRVSAAMCPAASVGEGIAYVVERGKLCGKAKTGGGGSLSLSGALHNLTKTLKRR